MKFAENTSVSVSKSRMEIDELVTKAGAKNVLTMLLGDGRACVMFTMADRNVKFTMPMPAKSSFAEKKDPRYTWRTKRLTAEQQQKAWEQACRSGWRALLLTIKAKLISVDSKVETFEEAFMPHIVVVTEDGAAVRFGELAARTIAQSYIGNGAKQLGSGA